MDDVDGRPRGRLDPRLCCLDAGEIGACADGRADLAVEQPSKIDLVINVKTAKELGLAIPQSLKVQAELVE